MINILLTIVILAITLLSVPSAVRADDRPQLNRPNVLLIYTDDQAANSMANMPYLNSLPKQITFDRGYTTTAICTPSRASLWTGQLASNHGVQRNGWGKRMLKDGGFETTMDVAIRNAGYRTGFAGKIMNGVKPKSLPGYDYLQSRQANPVQVFDQAATFIEETAVGQPWFFFVSTTAPHKGVRPTSYARQIEPVFPPLTPDIGEADISDKPEWLQKMYRRVTPTAAERLFYSSAARTHYQTLYDVDAGIEQLIATLELTGQRDNTIIIYTSDHGIGWGSHRIGGKGGDKAAPYESLHRVPFRVIWPGQESRTLPYLVDNVDLTATLYELTGAQPLRPPDGDSFAGLILDEETAAGEWDNIVYLEKFPDRNKSFHYFGYVTETEKVVWYPETDEEERYDLLADPYELVNLAGGS